LRYKAGFRGSLFLIIFVLVIFAVIILSSFVGALNLAVLVRVLDTQDELAVRKAS